MKPKLNKLTRPNDWPPPEEEVEEAKISLGGLKRMWLGGSVPDKPGWPNDVPPPPPLRRRGTHYKVITGSAHECEDNLNYYAEKKLLIEIVQMCASDNSTTILIKVYDGH